MGMEMKILKRHFKQRSFGDITGYNSGVSLMGPPPMTAWCYLADGVLIDTGTRHLRQPLLESLESNRPDHVLITHHHEDHSGNASVIRERFNVPVYGHAITAEKLRTSFKIKAYQHLVWGKSDPVIVEPFPDVIATKHLRFRPIHTPGHSKDHTAFLEETRGLLFSGDLFIGERIKFFRSDECLEDQILSIGKVMALDFDSLFCAHRPIMEKGKEALARKLDFLLNFYGTVKDLRTKGYESRAIIKKLDRKDDRTVKWITLNNACFAHMVTSAVRLAEKEMAPAQDAIKPGCP